MGPKEDIFVRKVIATFIAVLVLVTAAGGVGSAAGRVGVIDLALIMDESKAGREANAVLAAFIEERRTAVLELETHVDQLRAALEDDEQALTDDERAELEAELEEATDEYVAAVNQYDEELDAALQELRNHILSEIGIVLQMVGDAGGFDLIVDAASAYYYRRVVDLTFEVIREYDDLWDIAQRRASQP